jgi:hypothetical protein
MLRFRPCNFGHFSAMAKMVVSVTLIISLKSTDIRFWPTLCCNNDKIPLSVSLVQPASVILSNRLHAAKQDMTASSISSERLDRLRRRIIDGYKNVIVEGSWRNSEQKRDSVFVD